LYRESIGSLKNWKENTFRKPLILKGARQVGKTWHLHEFARAKDFELAIRWLVDCGLLLKSHRVSKPDIPLAAYKDLSVFKLFLHDVGLLGSMAGLNVRTKI